MNKLAGTTLEGGLHVWDCSQLDGSGRLAEVRSKVGNSTVWTGTELYSSGHYNWRVLIFFMGCVGVGLFVLDFLKIKDTFVKLDFELNS